MARPTVTGINQRVQVEPQPNAMPNLDVVAPMDVRVPTSAAGHANGWAALQGALGVGGKMYAEHTKKKGDESEQQGAADAALDRVDQERLERDRRYSDGVTRNRTIRETQMALSEIEERAATELPEGHTPEQKYAWFDQQVQETLGPIIDDPVARKVVAKYYEDYLQKAMGREVATARANHQMEQEEAYSIEVERLADDPAASLEDIAANIEAGTAVYGTRTEAWRSWVDAVARKAEATGDKSLLTRLIPSQIQTEDGQTIDSPARSKVNKSRLAQAAARIDKQLYEAQKGEREWTQALILNEAEDKILNGIPLSLADFEPHIKAGRISAEKAQALVNKSIASFKEAEDERAKDEALQAAFHKGGGESWLDAIGLPGGPETPRQAEKLTTASYQAQITEYARQNGLPEAPLSGAQLAEHPKLADAVIRSASRWRIGYEPMVQYMSALGPAMGPQMQKRLDFYEMASANGVVDLFVPDTEIRARFESIRYAQRAGVPEETINKMLEQGNDETVKRYVSENKDKAFKKLDRFKLDVFNKWFDTRVSNVRNEAIVTTKLRGLTEIYLRANLPPEEAAQLAYERFSETHMPLKIGSDVYVIPNPPKGAPYTAEDLAVAVEHMGNAAEAVARRHNVDEPEKARLTYEWGINGTGDEVTFVTADGVPFLGPIRPEILVEQVQKKMGFKYRDAIKAQRESSEKRRRDSRYWHDYSRARGNH